MNVKPIPPPAPLHAGTNTLSLIFDAARGSTNFSNLDELTIDGA
jgi:hypothetical protein